MGYGLLFVGYMFFTNFPVYGIDLPPGFVGYTLAYYALRKLGNYNKKYAIASKINIAMILTGFVIFAFQILRLLSVPGFDYDTIDFVLKLAVIFIMLFWYVFLISGTGEMAEQVRMYGLKKYTYFCMFFLALFYGYTLFANLYNNNLIQIQNGNFIIPLQQLAGLILRFIILLMIFICYRYISLSER